MAKKKKTDLDTLSEDNSSSSLTTVDYEDVSRLEDNFQQLIQTDPKYSLKVDPEHKYNFTETEVDFIEQMVQYRNVQFVSTVLLGLPLEEGVEIYKNYNVQSEIKRINIAMYARRFATKVADLNQIGGFLTSGLIDDNVPVAERWGPKEKLTASKLLMNINMLKKKAFNTPEVVEVVEVQKDLEKLSPKDLEKLIEINDEGNEEKEKLINLINEDGLLSMEELKNLRMMSNEELRDLAETIMSGDIEEDEESEED